MNTSGLSYFPQTIMRRPDLSPGRTNARTNKTRQKVNTGTQPAGSRKGVPIVEEGQLREKNCKIGLRQNKSSGLRLLRKQRTQKRLESTTPGDETLDQDPKQAPC